MLACWWTSGLLDDQHQEPARAELEPFLTDAHGYKHFFVVLRMQVDLPVPLDVLDGKGVDLTLNTSITARGVVLLGSNLSTLLGCSCRVIWSHCGGPANFIVSVGFPIVMHRIHSGRLGQSRTLKGRILKYCRAVAIHIGTDSHCGYSSRWRRKR